MAQSLILPGSPSVIQHETARFTNWFSSAFRNSSMRPGETVRLLTANIWPFRTVLLRRLKIGTGALKRSGVCAVVVMVFSTDR